jgi:transposase InsO family protein
VSARYAFIEAEYATAATETGAAPSIMQMCAWLHVSRSGYCEWWTRPVSATAARREKLRKLIRLSFDSSDGTYGHRRVHAELARWGHACSPELVRALMRELDLVPCQPRPWRWCLTDGADTGGVPDLVARDFTAATPGEKMVGDITYIPTWEGCAAGRLAESETFQCRRTKRLHSGLGHRTPREVRNQHLNRQDMA